MNKKQTAVEWLVEQFAKHYAIHQLENEIEQAKEMEKEQIIDSVNFGQNNYTDTTIEDKEIAEQYYNETFGGNNEQQ